MTDTAFLTVIRSQFFLIKLIKYITNPTVVHPVGFLNRRRGALLLRISVGYSFCLQHTNCRATHIKSLNASNRVEFIWLN